MKKNKQFITPPENGWEPQTYYHVEVSFSKCNPIFGCIFFTGFLDEKMYPCGYNKLFLNNDETEDFYEIFDVFYMRAIKKIISHGEIDMVPNKFKLYKDLIDFKGERRLSL